MTADPETQPLRIVIADDQTVVREGLEMVLDVMPNLEVVATVADGEQALRAVSEHRPDAILLDLHMPDERILDAEYIRTRLRPVGSEIKIIGISLSGNDDQEARELAASLGACTVLEKSRFYDELIPAILSC